jgi:metal-responsive CopG/Arc/MetJ family transcriptional regulator
MKTAISIPDPIFKEAEKAAKRLGMSRSELYARAVAEFVQILRRDGIKRQLDKIYAEEDSAIDSSLAKMQSSSVFRENW